MSQDLSIKSQNDNLCTYEYDKKRDSWDTIHMVQGTALVFMCPSLHKCIHDVDIERPIFEILLKFKEFHPNS